MFLHLVHRIDYDRLLQMSHGIYYHNDVIIYIGVVHTVCSKKIP